MISRPRLCGSRRKAGEATAVVGARAHQSPRTDDGARGARGPAWLQQPRRPKVTTSPDPHKRLWELIKHMRFGMLTHRHSNGSLHAHPLTTQNKSLEQDMTLYFFVSKKTELGQRLMADGNVNVSYSDPTKDT